MLYKYDEKSGQYYLMNGGKVVMTSKEISLCYSVNDGSFDDESGSVLLRHGAPEKVNSYLDYMKRLYEDAVPEAVQELRYFQGYIPVDDLNKLISKEISIDSYHREHFAMH